MPTIVGTVFVLLSTYFFFAKSERLFPLLIVSTVFQAASLLSSGIGIQPYYFVAILFVIKYFPTAIRKGPNAKSLGFLLCFVVVVAASALTLPVVFAGVPVFDPKIGIDEGVFTRPPLQLQVGNIVQVILLFVNALVVFSAAEQKHSDSAARAFSYAFYILAAVVITQYVCFIAGVPFPASVLNNNPSYSVNNQASNQLRPNGSFAEPSMAGAALAAFSGAFLSSYVATGKNGKKALFAVLTCVLVSSSSALLSVALIVMALLIANPIFRWPWFLRLDRIKRLSAFFVSGGLLASLLLLPSFRTVLLSQTLEKSESQSAFSRVAADLYALELFRTTHGLGVGLGSNRPSSLIASLLSQIGLPGVTLFLLFVAFSLASLPRSDRWIRWSAIALLLTMSVSIPDLSFPLLWVLFALAIQSRAAERVNANQLSGQPAIAG